VLGWNPTNVFWRQYRNLILDLTAVTNTGITIYAINWSSSQATSLENIQFKLSTVADNQQGAVFIDQGSGGWMSDLTVNGGNKGFSMGSQ